MACEEIIISFFISIMTGFISGYIVTKYYRNKDKERAELQRKSAVCNFWFERLMKMIPRTAPMDINKLYKAWDVGCYDPSLMEDILRLDGKYREHESISAEEVFQVIERLNQISLGN